MSKHARVSVAVVCVALVALANCGGGGSNNNGGGGPGANDGGPGGDDGGGNRNVNGTTSVAVGNIVEVGGTAGAISATYSATANGQPLTPITISVTAFPLNGSIVTAVPLLPVAGLTNPTLVFSNGGAMLRTVTLTAPAPSATPGSAIASFMGQIGSQSLTAPTGARDAVYATAVTHANQTASDMVTLIQKAQSAPVTLGSLSGQMVSLNSAALSFLDALVQGAQAPVVPLPHARRRESPRPLDANDPHDALGLMGAAGAGAAFALYGASAGTYYVGANLVDLGAANAVALVGAAQAAATVDAADGTNAPNVQTVQDAMNAANEALLTNSAAYLAQVNGFLGEYQPLQTDAMNAASDDMADESNPPAAGDDAGAGEDSGGAKMCWFCSGDTSISSCDCALLGCSDGPTDEGPTCPSGTGGGCCCYRPTQMGYPECDCIVNPIDVNGPLTCPEFCAMGDTNNVVVGSCPSETPGGDGG